MIFAYSVCEREYATLRKEGVGEGGGVLEGGGLMNVRFEGLVPARRARILIVWLAAFVCDFSWTLTGNTLCNASTDGR